MRSLNAVLAIPLLLALVRPGRAQGTPSSRDTLRIGLGFGVDTAPSPQHEVFALWRRYLSDRPDQIRASDCWSGAERSQWPAVDLTAPFIYQGSDWTRFQVTVVALEPAQNGSNDEYVIRTLFSRVQPQTGAVQPLALVRVFALRENGRWVLANALPRLTANWDHSVVGMIDFVYPTTHRFDRAKAERSARFVDSTALRFGIPAPAKITYYIAGSPEALARVIGLDFALSSTGRAYPANGIVLSGLPQYDEWYPHELAHMVLYRVVPSPARFFGEGAATWLGGSRGYEFPVLVRQLEAELARQPHLSLDSLLASHAPVDSLSYTVAAVLFQMAVERGGIPAVRALLAEHAGSPADIRSQAARVIGVAPGALPSEWRRAVDRIAALR